MSAPIVIGGAALADPSDGERRPQRVAIALKAHRISLAKSLNRVRSQHELQRLVQVPTVHVERRIDRPRRREAVALRFHGRYGFDLTALDLLSHGERCRPARLRDPTTGRDISLKKERKKV
jgi:hypothetical protein